MAFLPQFRSLSLPHADILSLPLFYFSGVYYTNYEQTTEIFQKHSNFQFSVLLPVSSCFDSGAHSVEFGGLIHLTRFRTNFRDFVRLSNMNFTSLIYSTTSASKVFIKLRRGKFSLSSIWIIFAC